MHHLVKTCGRLDEDIASIERKMLVTNFEECKAFQKIDEEQTRQGNVDNVVLTT